MKDQDDNSMATAHEQAELVRLFQINRILNQDQGGRRLNLLGTIKDAPALLTLERAAFTSDEAEVRALHAALTGIKRLEENDIYRWYMASSGNMGGDQSDLKINIISPCTEKQIKKYSPQEVRMVTETPEIYVRQIQPYIQRMRDEGRLNWVYNILEGRAEQENVILRQTGTSQDGQDESFLLLPDMNWDRKTLTSLHLLATPYRRDIWSLRDLTKSHVSWLKEMQEKVLDATTKVYHDVERDQIKLYVHYQPTHYHFHIHIVHVMAEATSTQSVGKAFGLGNIISQLEHMSGGPDAGFSDLTLSYYLGTGHDLWAEVYLPMKEAALK